MDAWPSLKASGISRLINKYFVYREPTSADARKYLRIPTDIESLQIPTGPVR